MYHMMYLLKNGQTHELILRTVVPEVAVVVVVVAVVVVHVVGPPWGWQWWLGWWSYRRWRGGGNIVLGQRR